MLRVRFHIDIDDPRPITFPTKHPYWMSGKADGRYVMISYADKEEDILQLWPEAENLESTEAEQYMFNDRFPKPDWFSCPPDMIEAIIPKAPEPVEDARKKPNQLLEMKEDGDSGILVGLLKQVLDRLNTIEDRLKR